MLKKSTCFPTDDPPVNTRVGRNVVKYIYIRFVRVFVDPTPVGRIQIKLGNGRNTVHVPRERGQRSIRVVFISYGLTSHGHKHYWRLSESWHWRQRLKSIKIIF